MSSTNDVCYLSISTSNFKKGFAHFGFSFKVIRQLMARCEQNSVGIMGSYTFKHVSESLGISTQNWETQPSDIDICITNPDTFKRFCNYYRRNNFHVETEFQNNGYCESMADVGEVVNIRPYRWSEKHLQLVLLKCKTVEEHLRNVDFDFTRVAYTTRGFMCVGNAIQSITSKKCKFLSSFSSIKQFNKTWKRSIKYIGRGIEFEYPDVIKLEKNVSGRIFKGALKMYTLTINRFTNEANIIKNVYVTRIDPYKEKLKQIADIVSSVEIKKLKDTIARRDMNIMVLGDELYDKGKILEDVKQQLQEEKKKLIDLKTFIIKQINQEQEQQEPNGWDDPSCGWDEYDIDGWDEYDVDGW